MFVFFVIYFSKQIGVFFRWIGLTNFVMVGKCWSLDYKERKYMRVGRGFGRKSQDYYIVNLWMWVCGWNMSRIFLVTLNRIFADVAKYSTTRIRMDEKYMRFFWMKKYGKCYLLKKFGHQRWMNKDLKD